MEKTTLNFSQAYELIKRETGIIAHNLEKPESMNSNPDWPYFQLQSGNMRIDIHLVNADKFLFGSRLTALSTTHGNSSSAVTEYFYSDTLEYAPEYTELENREDFCDIVGDKENDPVYKRLRNDASAAVWHHYHNTVENQVVDEKHGKNTSIEELRSIAINEAAAFSNFQGKLLQGHDLFKIRVFDLHGLYYSDTGPFDEGQMDWWVKEVTHGVNNNPDSAAGFTVFAWDQKNKVWMPYNPDGKKEYTYDTGRRPDGKIHEALKLSLPAILTVKERTPFNNLLVHSSSQKKQQRTKHTDPER